MTVPTVPVPCNKVVELTPFEDQLAAEKWLRDNALDTSGTSLLVPFKTPYKQIKFLKPGATKELTTNLDNNNLRIMGAGNNIDVHGFINWFEEKFTHRVPHVDELEGDTISLVEHGFIIIYAKRTAQVGRKFVEFFNEEKQILINKIKAAPTNKDAYINEGEFLEKLSILALELDIKGGMTYFFTKDAQGKQHVYRHTFKQDPANEKIAAYLAKEEECHEAQAVIVDSHKSTNHHYFRFLKDWLKWTVFAVLTAVLAGVICGIFITTSMVAAIVAVGVFLGLSGFGFHKAHQSNLTTIESGTTDIYPAEPNLSLFTRVKQFFAMLGNFVNEKLGLVVLPKQTITAPIPTVTQTTNPVVLGLSPAFVKQALNPTPIELSIRPIMNCLFFPLTEQPDNLNENSLDSVNNQRTLAVR